MKDRRRDQQHFENFVGVVLLVVGVFLLFVVGIVVWLIV